MPRTVAFPLSGLEDVVRQRTAPETGGLHGAALRLGPPGAPLGRSALSFRSPLPPAVTAAVSGSVPRRSAQGRTRHVAAAAVSGRSSERMESLQGNGRLRSRPGTRTNADLEAVAFPSAALERTQWSRPSPFLLPSAGAAATLCRRAASPAEIAGWHLTF